MYEFDPWTHAIFPVDLGGPGKVDFEHLDDTNPHTFEIQDLHKLITKVSTYNIPEQFILS